MVKNAKTFNFVKYYKSTSETQSADKNSTVDKCEDIEIQNETPATISKKKVKKSKKNGNIKNINKIDINGKELGEDVSKDSSFGAIEAPQNKDKSNIKSIIKGSMDTDNTMDSSSKPESNRKKRNKSVSFMLEDNEHVIVKKTKSNDIPVGKQDDNNVIKHNKATNKKKIDITEKSENKLKDSKSHMKKKKAKKIKPNQNVVFGDNQDKPIVDATEDMIVDDNDNIKIPKSLKTEKKHEVNTQESDVLDASRNKKKKLRKPKTEAPTAAAEVKAVPKKKKKKNKPDAIAQAIESLNIGDNVHTLSNLLDDLKVKKERKGKKERKVSKTDARSDHDAMKQENEIKPKSKRSRNSRKNKLRNANAAVLVQNLPFTVILDYKQKLRELFSKYGSVCSVGIADLKCVENNANPIFTTRVFFKTPEEAKLALAENNALFEGNIIRVKKYRTAAAHTFKSSFNKYKKKTSEEPSNEQPNEGTEADINSN